MHPDEHAGEEILATIEMMREHIISKLMHDAGRQGLNCLKLSVTLPQLRTLEVIARHDGINNKHLAGILHVTQASASAMVERLVEMGLIERLVPNDNRRTVQLRLSRQGQAILRRQRKLLRKVLVELLEQLGPDHTRMWLCVCNRLREILSENNAFEQTGRHGGLPSR